MTRDGGRGDSRACDRRPRDRPARPGDEGDPVDLLRRRARPRRALDTLAGIRGQGPGGLLTGEIGLSAPWLEEREEELVLETLRSGRLSLGPMIERFEAALAERVGAPLRGGRLERHRRASPGRAPGGPGGGRRGRDDAVLLRGLRELRALRGRDAGVRGHRPTNAEPPPGRGRRGDHPAHEGDPRRGHLRLPGRVRRARGDRRAARPRAHRGRLRGARCRVPGGADRVARRAGRLRLLPEQADDDGGGRRRRRPTGGGVGAPEEPLQPGPERLRRMAHAFAPRATTIASTTSRPRSGSRKLEKLDRILELRAEVAARYAELLGDVDGVELPARRRRRPPALVVRLRRPARGGDRPERRHGASSPGRASPRKPYLPSIHLQPYWRERFGTSEGMFPVSEDASRALPRAPLPHAARPEQTRSVWSKRWPHPCDNRRMADGSSQDGLPRLREVRPRGQDLRARAPDRRRTRRRAQDARLGGGNLRADRRLAHRALDPRRDGHPGRRPRRRFSTTR